MSCLEALVEEVGIRDGESNRWFWPTGNERIYTTKKGYKILNERSSFNPVGAWSKLIWAKVVPLKVNEFVWKAIQDRLPTKA